MVGSNRTKFDETQTKTPALWYWYVASFYFEMRAARRTVALKMEATVWSL